MGFNCQEIPLTIIKPSRGSAFFPALALTAIAIASCKTSVSVDRHMILPPGAQVMDIPKDEIFLMASPISQPMPSFPAGGMRGADIETCIEIVIDQSGAVSSATPLYELPECPLRKAEVDQRFVTSAVNSVRQWRFLAAAVCTFPPGSPKTANCFGDGVTISPVSIKLSYVFSFQVNERVAAKAKRA